ncbi:hypothetical protein [Aquisphaera insulae]|uniref:hypothetical protein n=1 Tax=Aquisphaera insulae TaxID=2712864 RepID=UPI0013EE2169|nr:hypothetical protein [Aquisphaera insulae]
MQPPSEASDHAQDFARRYALPLDAYCAIRMEELKIPDSLIGADDLRAHMKWTSFDPEGREGGTITRGIVVNSGVLNPELLKGEKGGKAWEEARLRDRIDAIIAHGYEESRLGDHLMALKAAAKTKLPITNGARRICRAMAR